MSVGCQGLERVADLVPDVLCADKQTGARPREARRGGEGQQVGSERQGGVDFIFFCNNSTCIVICDHRPYFQVVKDDIVLLHFPRSQMGRIIGKAGATR